jgi:hypothetical protein
MRTMRCARFCDAAPLKHCILMLHCSCTLAVWLTSLFQNPRYLFCSPFFHTAAQVGRYPKEECHFSQAHFLCRVFAVRGRACVWHAPITVRVRGRI